MASFDYIGRDRRGQKVKGTMNAYSKEGVAELLVKDSVIPVKITVAGKKRSVWDISFGEGKVKLEDMLAFCRQIHTMIRAGISVVDALNNISDSTQSHTFKIILPRIIESISAGRSFSETLKNHPKHFDNVFVNMVAAGESSGLLEGAFLQLATYLQKEDKIVKKVKTAMRYPVTLMIVFGVAVLVVSVFVIPKFALILENFGQNLPMLTVGMLAVSAFMIESWKLALGVVLAFYIGFKQSLKIPVIAYQKDKLMLRLPIFGKIVRNAILSRFSRIFAALLESGIPLINALELVSTTIGNSYVTEQILNLHMAIESGESLSSAASKGKVFSPLVIQMISIGEKSGAIDSLLFEVASYYEEEVDYDLSRLSDLIEPVMLVIMGGMVLILALAIFQPIWALQGS
jgi:MSHA biogenesis protein MshG